MANQRWTAEKNIQFISVYQQNNCLWDPKHPNYKNMPARVAAYKMIMKAMEMESVKGVVTKIRILRNTYNNEMLKTKKLNSMGTGEPYMSKIPWLPHMDFLKNIDSQARETCYGVPKISQEASASVSESENKESAVPRPFRRNKIKPKDPLVKVVEALDKILKQQPSNSSKGTNDEFDLFGQTVAEQLRQMPLETALETEEMILATMRQQRIRDVKHEPSSP